MNRVEKIADQLTGGPVYNMKLLLNTLSPSTIVPDVDKYYVFMYKAKTPRILYDRHPFIVCSSLHKWGFIGLNIHWNGGDWRRYTWNELITNLYEVHEDEVEMVQQFDLAKFMRS